jgi:hypothetical protein
MSNCGFAPLFHSVLQKHINGRPLVETVLKNTPKNRTLRDEKLKIKIDWIMFKI